MSENLPSNLQNKLAASLQPKTDNKKAVLDKLRHLRDNHTLGLHSWEDMIGFCGVPSLQRDVAWRNVTADTIPPLLSKDQMPLISLSLVPSSASGMALLPFRFKAKEGPTPGYFFTLKQNISNPAKIIKLSPNLIFSGDELHDKQLYLNESVDIEALNNFYKEGKSRQELCKKIAMETNGEHSLYQLNTLGKYYENLENKPDENIIKTNEVIAAATKEHICSIVIPIGTFPNDPERNKMKTAIYYEAMELAGAFTGLMHLNKGVDFPVALYNVTPKNKLEIEDYKQGDFIYVGQGRQELAEKLISNLRYLDAHRDEVKASEKELNWLSYFLVSNTGIDLFKPLSTQKVAMSDLAKGTGLARGRV